jgi:hypothetical protein
MTDAAIVFHLPRRYLGDYARIGHLRLFARIEQVLSPLGARTQVRDRRLLPIEGGKEAAQAYADGNLHIIENGRVQGAGVLNATMAYLPPFWHLDPQGVLAESSIAARMYDRTSVPLKPAMVLLGDLRDRWVTPRRSRHTQTEWVADLPRGCIAVFMQGTLPQSRGLAHCSPAAMLAAVAQGAAGRSVLAKPHPLALEHDLAVIAEVRAQGLAVTATNANLHDILAACGVTVSFNSAVAIEGFVHRKPAILFGPSDFHHFAQTVTDPAGFPEALAMALARPKEGYAQFLHWYFARQCLNVDAKRFRDKLLVILTAAGFPAERLGIDMGKADGSGVEG